MKGGEGKDEGVHSLEVWYSCSEFCGDCLRYPVDFLISARRHIAQHANTTMLVNRCTRGYLWGGVNGCI